MTISEASERGIKRLWRPPWSHTSWMEIDLLPGGMHGPWAHVTTLPFQVVTIPLWEVPKDGWSEWKEPPDA